MKQTPHLGLAIIVIAAPFLLGACLLMGASGFGLPSLDTEIGKAIMMLRVNRVACGFLVGAALSCAGVVLQSMLRNPLAEPYVLGVSSGAGLGAAVAILSGLCARLMFLLPLSAFLGAVLTLCVVYLFARQGGSTSVYGLILSGVIISSICSSLLMFLVATAPAEGLHTIMWWMLGNLQPTSRDLLALIAGIILVSGVLVWLLSRELNALALGEEVAHYVGVRTRVFLPLALGLATLMTAAAVSMAGLVGFVGLIVPHAMRSIVGANHRRLVPAAFVGGGVFLAVCDAVARTALEAVEIPVGVVTAVCGGPFFLMILRRKRKRGWIG